MFLVASEVSSQLAPVTTSQGIAAAYRVEPLIYMELATSHVA